MKKQKQLRDKSGRFYRKPRGWDWNPIVYDCWQKRAKQNFNDFLIHFKKNSSKKKRTYAGIVFCQRGI